MAEENNYSSSSANVAGKTELSPHSSIASLNSNSEIRPNDCQLQLYAAGLFLVYLIILGALAVWLTKNEKHHEWALKIVAVLSIVGGVIIVCLLHLPQEYVTAIVGLLGTMAGFILRGKDKDK